MTRRHVLEYAALAITLATLGWLTAQATFWATIAVAFHIWGIR